MERAPIDGITLEYEVTGRGEPVVFIHGAFIADSFRPLLAEPSLADRFRLITYHRRGYAGSSPTSGRVSVAQQAADCRGLLRYLGVAGAHVVGHSWGGCFALQLALEAPELVQSLVVLEPGLMVGASGQAYRESLLRAEQRYQDMGPATVLDGFMEARWPGYRPTLDRVLPRAYDQAVADASTTLGADLGLLDWRITQPYSSSSAATASRSILASERRTDSCSRGCRTPKGLSFPAQPTLCSLRNPASWPRCWRASSAGICWRPEGGRRSSEAFSPPPGHSGRRC